MYWAENTSELDKLCTAGTRLWEVPQALQLCVTLDWGCVLDWGCLMDWGCFPEPFCSRKKLIRMQTTVLAPPTAPGSGPRLAGPEEANSTCPQYQTVPDFQRVQITGDYASGVGTAMAAPFPDWPPLWSLSSAQ